MLFLSIGPENSRRLSFWRAAVESAGYTHASITYEALLQGAVDLAEAPACLRICSPGEDLQLYRKLLAIGEHPDLESLQLVEGQYYPNTYWYKGWANLLDRLQETIRSNPQLEVLNTPAAIKLAFHKLHCQQQLQLAKVSVPKILLEHCQSYDHFIEVMQASGVQQVFIKPIHGSSAAGVMAFRHNKKRSVLYSTLSRQAPGKIFNSLGLSRYSKPTEIRSLITEMIPAHLMVEEWVPKKSHGGKSVDLRILVIDGIATFVVPRMSKHMITNLHLGNEKGQIRELEESWGVGLIEEAKRQAELAVKTIEGLFYAGVDVAISSGGNAYVLEVNAFGDLLLNIFHEGKNTYQYALQSWLKRKGL